MLSTRRQRAVEAEVASNMARFQSSQSNRSIQPVERANFPHYDVIPEEGIVRNRNVSQRANAARNGDFVKPELPEFLQNMGPGIRSIKKNIPITLSWYDIRAQAPAKQGFIRRKVNQCLGKEVEGPKNLLKGVSGIVKPGQMCAIMGASGAGKTTLINILTYRRPGKLKISRDVRINGIRIGKNISRLSSFMQQDELFIGSLTVREHLKFHSMLRLGREFTNEERINRVDEILDFLNLTKSQDTTIGIPGMVKGLSGGEKRRLTFATEILADPPLVFFDEPTSGLDSAMAFLVVRAMRKLADLGKTIICTIHQPSSEIFYLFDQLYLLAEGRVAYFGSLEKAPTFFRTFGLEIPVNYNPSDFYIQQLAIYPKTREQNLAQIEFLCNQYENSPQNARYLSEIQKLHNSSEDDFDIENESFFVRLLYKISPVKPKSEYDLLAESMSVDGKKTKYKTNRFTQFRWLAWRNLVNIFKNPFEVPLRFALSIFIGVLIGLLYIRLKYDQTAIQNMNSLIFLLIINVSFATIFSVTQSYTRQYPIFYKDHDDAVYSVIPYFFAKFLTELPAFVLATFIQMTITYWMANLYASAKRFFIFAGIMTLISMAAVAMGTVISVISNSPDQAQAIQVPIMLPLMIFGGFFLSNGSGKQWITWIKYISWFYYGNEALIINQWTDVETLPCDNLAAGSPCITSGKGVIEFVSYDTSNFARDIILTAVIWGSLVVLSFLILAIKAKWHK